MAIHHQPDYRGEGLHGGFCGRQKGHYRTTWGPEWSPKRPLRTDIQPCVSLISASHVLSVAIVTRIHDYSLLGYLISLYRQYTGSFWHLIMRVPYTMLFLVYGVALGTSSCGTNDMT